MSEQGEGSGFVGSELDRKMMGCLPRWLARIVALKRQDWGLLPEMEGDPQEMWSDLLTSFGTDFLNEWQEEHRQINTLVFKEDPPIVIHADNWKEGDQEIKFYWKRQVEWAEKVLIEPTGRDVKEIKEANHIMVIQEAIDEMFYDVFGRVFEKNELVRPLSVREKVEEA